MYKDLEEFIRELYPNKDFIALHEPVFVGNEKEYLNQCIDSTFVSYLGEYVGKSEELVKEISGCEYAVATSSGTTALHLALLVAGVGPNDLVLTQALSFVATANAIKYINAEPVFLDSDSDSLGLCAKDLEHFLNENALKKNGECYYKKSGQRISACVPMHVFGHAVDIDKIVAICKEYGIKVVEDAAEALGSSYNQKPLGSYGDIGIYSFNGNKVVTCGGGGMLVTNDKGLATRAKHLSTTAKKPHAWEFFHDEVGYNYRLTNLNAAVLCAQLEKLDSFIDNKRATASKYSEFFKNTSLKFVEEPKNSRSNYWLNAIITNSINEREDILSYFNGNKIMMRPVWRLLNELPMYEKSITSKLINAKFLADRIINIPSSVRL